jgi:hypothetical protein
MAGFKSQLEADIISETVADLRRNQQELFNVIAREPPPAIDLKVLFPTKIK